MPDEPTIQPAPDPPAPPAQEQPAPDPRIAELTAQLDAHVTELATLRGQLGEAHTITATLQHQVAAAATAYREAALATAPDVPPELVSGATVEEVQASLEAARATVEAVKARIQTPPAPPTTPAPPPPIPAGGGGRTPPDYSGLSAFDKIKAGLNAGS